MSAFQKIDLKEATRLTREGRLEEAMAVLRSALPSAPTPASPSDVKGGAAQTTKHESSILVVHRRCRPQGMKRRWPE
jgi:hypothetical protein